jgi:cytochrome c-type biogenesis protein CcmH/NrfG
LQKQNRLREAVDAYEQSLQLDPGNQYLRGLVGKLSGRLQSL